MQSGCVGLPRANIELLRLPAWLIHVPKDYSQCLEGLLPNADLTSLHCLPICSSRLPAQAASSADSFFSSQSAYAAIISRSLQGSLQLPATETQRGLALQGRSAVETWLLLAGSTILGSLAGLTWRLVRGWAITEPVNKALMAAILVCMLVIIILTTLSKSNGKSSPAVA